MFAMASLSATSLDVVRHYAAAQEAASNNKFEEARQSLLEGRGARSEVRHRLPGPGRRRRATSAGCRMPRSTSTRRCSHLDGMTERERFSTRGMFYRVTGDYQQCVKEYGELIARYAADVVGRNQLALCLTQLRDMRRRLDEMRQVVELLPKRALFRDNLALYANYAGDFQTGEQEARTVEEPDAYATLALAFAQLGQGQVPQATETYSGWRRIDALGASFAASASAISPLYEGRFSDAVRILEQARPRTWRPRTPTGPPRSSRRSPTPTSCAGRTRAAVAAAEKALANSKAVKIRFLAARIVRRGRRDRQGAGRSSTGLAASCRPSRRPTRKIVEGEIALKAATRAQAIKLLTEANALLDTWIGHFDLGRAYLEAGQFPQADSEFDRCLKRRGEALSLFLDEEPTYALLPAGLLLPGPRPRRAEERRLRRVVPRLPRHPRKSREDPLLADVRQRAGAR